MPKDDELLAGIIVSDEQRNNEKLVADATFSTENASKYNPEEFAKHKALADKVGFDPLTVADNPFVRKEAEFLARQKAVDLPALAQTHPNSAKALADPVTAALIHDDVGAMQTLEDSFKLLHSVQQLVMSPKKGKGSVGLMGKYKAPPAEALIDVRGAPVSTEAYQEIKRQYDLATSEERIQMATIEGPIGAVARTLAEGYAKADELSLAVPTLQGLGDTRRAAAEGRLIALGASPKLAAKLAAEGAGRDPTEGVATATTSTLREGFQGEAPKQDRTGVDDMVSLALTAKRGVARGVATLGRQASAAHALIGTAVGADRYAEANRKRYEEMRQYEADLGEQIGAGYLKKQFEGALSSTISNIPALAAGVATGGQAVALTTMGGQVGADETLNGLSQGLSGEEAVQRGAIYGAAEALGEKFGLSSLVKGLRGAAAGVSTSELTKFFADNLKKEIPGELLTSNIQYGADVQYGLQQADLESYLTNMRDTVVQTVMQSGVVTSAGLATGAAVRKAKGENAPPPAMPPEVDQAVRTNEALQEISKAAVATKLRERDPAAFKQFMQTMADESGMTELYVDANALTDALAKAPEDLQQSFMQSMPEVAAQLEEGVVTDGLVRMSVGDYATHIAGTELDAAVLPNAKATPEGLTYAQTESAMKDAQEGMKQQAEEIVAKKAEDAAYQADVQKLRDDLVQQLDTAQRFRPEVNKQYAELASAYYITAAQDLGIKPTELMAQHPLNIQAEQTLPKGALEQVRQTETPEFKNWFGESKVVDAEGKPLVVYHSTTYGDFDTFSKKDQRKGMAGFGFYFTDKEGSNIYSEHAATFKMDKAYDGTPKRVNTMPIYLRMENPYVIDNIADLKTPGAGFGASREHNKISDEAKHTLQLQGYDGIVTNEYVRVKKNGSLEVVAPDAKGAIKHPVYVVFEPTQIKSATGNRGTFDPNDPNILNQQSSAYGYRARDAARKATLQSFAPEQVKDLLRKTDWAILTAENPNAQKLTPEENAARMDELKADLQQRGIRYEVAESDKGNSLAVVGITREDALQLGLKYGQDSVLTRAGLVYQDGTVNSARKVNVLGTPSGFYTKVGEAVFSVEVDTLQRPALPLGDRLGETQVDVAYFAREVQGALNGQRLSFYVDEGKGVSPEANTGPFRHELTLTNMYDAASNPLRLPAEDLKSFEAAVADAGFDGYYVRKSNMSVALRGEGKHLIVRDGKEVGYLKLDIAPEALRIADLEIKGLERNKGIGSEVIREVQEQAKQAGKAVVLSTDAMRGKTAQEKQRRLYERLGFVKNRDLKTDGIKEEFVWYPPQEGLQGTAVLLGEASKNVQVDLPPGEDKRYGQAMLEIYDNPPPVGKLSPTDLADLRKLWSVYSSAEDNVALYGTSQAKDMDTIVYEVMGEEAQAKNISAQFDLSQGQEKLAIDQGPRRGVVSIDHNDKSMQVDLSGWGEGGGGAGVYKVLMTYAQNNGYTFYGDAQGISEAGMRRRLENLLSFAIQSGSTDGMVLHPNQFKYIEERTGVPLNWIAGDSKNNIEQMLNAAYNLTNLDIPELQNVYFDLNTNQFVDAGKGGAPADLAGLVTKARRDADLLGRKGTAGIATAKRTALGNTLLRAATPETRRLVFDKLASLSLAGLPGAEQLLYQSAPTFYSQLAKQIEATPDRIFQTGKQVSDWLDSNAAKLGIKKDEIEATGVRDWLQTQGKISKADVQNFLMQGGVQVSEVMLGGERKLPASKVREMISDGERIDVYLDGKRIDYDTVDTLDDAVQLEVVPDNSKKATKFAAYQLPGGENYKELLLTLPVMKGSNIGVDARKAVFDRYANEIETYQDIVNSVAATPESREAALATIDDIVSRRDAEADAAYKLEADRTSFRSSHFDQPNILAHIRFNERTDAEGKRVLFLEEIQSDWGQKGKKVGFQEKPVLTKTEEGKWLVSYPDGRRFGEYSDKQDAEAAMTRARDFGGKIPSAPFVTDTKSWTALALKRMVRYAAENGFDKVAWTTGEQQAERYDLSKQVEEISAFPNGDGTYDLELTMPGGATQNVRLLTASGLEENIGKDLAQKIIDDSAKWSEANTAYRAALKETGVPESRLDELKAAVDAIDLTYSGLDLKVGGEGMKGYYDQIVPQVANDVLKKIGGGKVEAVALAPLEKAFGIRERRDGKWIVTRDGETYGPPVDTELAAKEVAGRLNGEMAQQGFTITPDMRARVMTEGQALFQENRGAFNPETMTISLLKKADLSTFLHESGHAFLELDVALASRPDAPDRIKQRVADTLKWFGVQDLATWKAMTLEEKRPYHERFARGFEAYLMEGKAPSAKLNGIFASFRSWLLHIYRRLVNLNVELTPEVRSVFDRMLATDDAIKEAEFARGYGQLQVEGAPDGAEATNAAVDELQRRSMRDMKWLGNARSKELKKLQKQAAGLRAAIRAEVAAEVQAEPIEQARLFLRKGEMTDPNTGEQVKADKGFRLDNAALKDLYPETMLARPDVTALRGMTMNNGLHPDLVADMFGFPSGDALVRELISAGSTQSKIDGMTDQRMLEEHGDLVDDRALEQAADAAVHNEARARFMATGLKVLTKSPLTSRQIVMAAADAAHQIVAAKRVRDLRPAQYTSAETKANREALKEAPRSPEKAQRAQRSALMNNQLAKAALDAQEDVRKGVEKMQRVQKAAAQDKMRGEYLAQLNALLERFDLRKSTTLKEIDTKRTPLGEWVQTEADRLSAVVPDIPAWVLNEGHRESYKNLTVEEFRGLLDTVKALEMMARREQEQYKAIRGMKFKEERRALLDRIREFHPEAFSLDGEPMGMSPKFVKHFKDNLKDMGDKFTGEFLNAENILGMLEGGQFGIVNESLFGRMSARADWKASRMGEIQEQIKPLFAQYNVKERYDFGRKDIGAPIGMGLTRENALVVALLHGNAEGRERLANYGWPEATQKAIIDLLDERDLRVADGIWKLFDEQLWPQLRELNDRTRGKSPPKVEALPFDTKHGKARGGYFRLKYDTDLDERAHRLDEGAAVKELLGGGMGIGARTAQGSSTERKQNVTLRPRLDLGVFAEAVTETVHDLAYREAVADTMRMLNDAGIQNAIKTVAGTPAYRSLVTRVREIAAPPRNPSGFIENTLSIARKNTIVTLMSGVNTALQNFTGFSSALSRAAEEGYSGRLAKEIALFYSHKMTERYDFAVSQSEYMKNRHNSFERELQNEIKKMTIDSNVMPEMGTWLVLMSTVDKGTSVPIWNAAFYHGMEKFNNDKDKAVAYADHSVRQTQGSGRELDIARIMGGHGGWGQLKRVFTMFQSYFNSQLGMLVRSGAVNAHLAKTNPVLASARFTRDFMLVFVIPAVMTKMLFSPPDRDPEEWERNYLRALVQYGMAMIPLAGSFMNSLWAQFDDTAPKYGYKITPVEAAPEGVTKAAKSAKDIAEGSGDDKDLRNLIMGVGYVARLPGKLISDLTLGVKAWLEGDAGPEVLVQGPPRK